MATYIVGDIHGCFREWIRFKSKIEHQDVEAEYILVGDILDKGPNSFEMLQWAMERIQSGSKFQMVMGNHEAEKLEWLKYVLNNFENEEWKNQDIARKMLSPDGYAFYKICCEKNLNRQQLTKILKWLEELPECIERTVNTTKGIRHFLITHYKLPTEKNIIIHFGQQGEQDRIFSYKLQEEKLTEKQNFIVIHGHIPTIFKPCKSAGAVPGKFKPCKSAGAVPEKFKPCKSEGAVPGKIWIQEGEINVDCGLVYGVSKSKGLYGDLAALRLEDFQEFYYYNHPIFY